MAPRPYWKGYLKLSLVSCPVAVYPATSSGERVSFRQINRKTGNRLRQMLVDDVTREPVEAEDKARGFEIGKNEYLLIEDDEVENLEIESTQTVEIDSFVPAAQIDKRYFDSPYYVVPNDAVGQEAFAVIREAMRGKDMVALGRVVMGKRERVIALEPEGKGLLGTTLRYPYEVREADAYFEDIADVKVEGEMLKLAEHILDSKAADFDPSQFEDRYETALVEMLRRKQEGFAPAAATAPRQPAKVINLMDALKRSLQGDRKTAAAEKPAAKAAAGKPAAKGKKGGKANPEELRKSPQFKFPISGGKAKDAKADGKQAETAKGAGKAAAEAKAPARRAAGGRRRAG